MPYLYADMFAARLESKTLRLAGTTVVYKRPLDE